MARDPVLSFLDSFQGQLLRQRQLNIEAMAEQSRNTRFEASLAEQQAGRLQTAGFQRQRIDLERKRFEASRITALDPGKAFERFTDIGTDLEKFPGTEALARKAIQGDIGIMNLILNAGLGTGDPTTLLTPAPEIPTAAEEINRLKLGTLRNLPTDLQGAAFFPSTLGAAATPTADILRREALSEGGITPATTQSGDILRRGPVVEAREAAGVNVPGALEDGVNLLGGEGGTPLPINRTGRNSIPQSTILKRYLIWRKAHFYDDLEFDGKKQLDDIWDTALIPIIQANPPSGVSGKRIFWDPQSAEIRALRGQ